MRSTSLRLADAMRTGVSPAFADRGQDGLAAQPGEHEVEHDEVDRDGVEGIERLDGDATVASRP